MIFFMLFLKEIYFIQKTNLQKNLYTHTVCNKYYKCKKLADNITSIII